jgi:phage shock protein A
MSIFGNAGAASACRDIRSVITNNKNQPAEKTLERIKQRLGQIEAECKSGWY